MEIPTEIKGKWNMHCRSRCRRGRMGLVSLRVLRPIVFVPHGAKEHHGTFPTGPTDAPFSISNHHTVTLHPYSWNVFHRPHNPPPPFSISNPHTVTLHAYPQTFVPVSRGCTPPPLTYAHTKTIMKAPPHTHPPPHPSLLPPSSLLPFPWRLMVGRVGPFLFAGSLYVLCVFTSLHTTSLKSTYTVCKYADLHLPRVCWCVS